MKETLEEAAERTCESITHPYCDREKSMFIKGARWQADRMYSEEEVFEAILFGAKWQAERMYSKFDLDAEITKLNTPDRYDNVKHKYNYSESDIVNLFEKWFEQHKK